MSLNLIPLKILVIQQKMIGDVLTSSVLCQNLKEQLTNCEVHFLAHTHTIPVIENNPYIDRIVDFKQEYRKNKSSFFRFLKKIKNEKYDAIIDVYGKWESNIITIAGKAPITIAYYKSYTRFFYTNPIKRHKKDSYGLGLAIEHRLKLLLPIIKNKDINELAFKPTIYLSDKEIKTATAFLDEHNIDRSKPVYMIGALGSGPSKSYPLAYLAKVIDLICANSECTLLFNYIPSQLPEVTKLYQACSEQAKQQIRLGAYTKSLREFMAVLSQCTALIGNEGGAVNMAKALNIPTFSIFCPWVPKEDWNLFDGQDNVGVHLKDYRQELYDNMKKRNIKKDYKRYYQEFKPDFFAGRLQEFLTRLSSENKHKQSF